MIVNYSCYLYNLTLNMNASKRNLYVSSLSDKADQKEVIIAHLREEIYLLKRNEQELYRLKDQYQALEHRLKELQDEKNLADADFKERHDLATRTIEQLKNQFDALKNDLRQRNLEISDLKSDENTLLGQLDQRAIELNKLKNQLSSLIADSEQLLNQKLRYEQAHAGVSRDNEKIGSNIRDLSNSNHNVNRKTEQLQKYLFKQKTEEASLKQKIIAYQNKNNGLDSDINAKNEDVSGLEAKISNAQNELNTLQKDIAQEAAISDKHKSQSLHNQKSTQAEVICNNDLTKQLNQAQNVFRLRNNQVADSKKTTQQIQAENNKWTETNNGLRNDIQSCRRHLQSLSLLNSELVLNLEKYSQEDDIVLSLIDRKRRFLQARNRIEEAAVTSRIHPQASPRRPKHNY